MSKKNYKFGERAVIKLKVNELLKWPNQEKITYNFSEQRRLEFKASKVALVYFAKAYYNIELHSLMSDHVVLEIKLLIIVI